MIRKKIAIFMSLALITVSCAACNKSSASEDSNSDSQSNGSAEAVTTTDVSLDDMDFTYSDRDLDASYDESTAVKVTLGDSIKVDGSGATASGKTLTITDEGTYILSGTLAEGQIVVTAADDVKVQIVLDGVTISNKSTAAISVTQGDKVFITLAEGSKNTITSGVSSSSEDGIDGAIFSKSDLTFNGTGILNVTADAGHGIVSKDDLVFASGVYTIDTTGDAIQGKDCVKIADGTYTITSDKDGIQSTNAEDTTKGFISVDGGKITITSTNDGIQAETVLRVATGEITLVTGSGSANASTKSGGEANPGWGNWGGNKGTSSNTTDKSNTTNTTDKSNTTNTTDTTESTSAKGLKAGSLILINDGTINADTSDDSVHSNGDFQMEKGTIKTASGDDGIHADSSVIINGGDIEITKSYEGIEGQTITVTGGNINLVASDDGFNAAGGNDSSSVDGRQGMNDFAADNSALITVSGGYIVVDASGDGMDSNGNFNMTGGTVLVSGPTNDGNGPMDYGGEASITGGIAIIAGSTGMAQNFGSSSTQVSAIYGYSSSQSAKTLITLTDKDGKVIASYAPPKEYACVVISSPEMNTSDTFTLYSGGTVSDADDNTFASSGTIDGGTSVESLTFSSTSCSVGTSVGTRGMGGGGMQGGGMQGGGMHGDMKGDGMPSGEMPTGNPPDDKQFN